MTDDSYNLVACADCGSVRSARWEKCFCGETRTKKAPPVDKTPAELLREARVPMRLEDDEG